MIEPDTIIRFSPDDQPPLPETDDEPPDAECEAVPQPPSQTPEPTAWRPIGAEW